MKKGVSRHPKTIKLARTLGVNRHEATGLLNDLWEYTGEYATAGDVGRHDNEEIAIGIGWSGDASALVDALVSSGWLDEDEQYRLVVHDWKNGCDQWVKHRLSRLNQDFITTKSVRTSSVHRTKKSVRRTRGLGEGRVGKDREGKDEKSALGLVENPPAHLHQFIKGGKHPAIDQSLLEQADFIEHWQRWLEHLKAKSKKPTPHAVDLQLRKLELLKHKDRIATIEASIAGNWQGLYPPSESRGSSQPKQSDELGDRLGTRELTPAEAVEALRGIGVVD